MTLESTPKPELLSVLQASHQVDVLESEGILERARAELHQAIRAAHQAGHSYRAIAQAAGISHQRVAQLLQKGEK